MLSCLSKLLLISWLILGLKLLPMAQSQRQNNANLLCTQMLNARLLEKCCGDSKPSNLPFMSSKCENYEDDYGACRYECIYNHFHLLHSNGSLNMPNVDTMIKKLYLRGDGYYSYSLMLQESFEHCESLSATYNNLVQLYASLPDPNNKCNKNAFIYAKCTIANMFLNCPMEFWDEMAEDCADSRRLLAHCIRFLNSVDDSISPGKLRTHNASTSHRLKIRSIGASIHWYLVIINWLLIKYIVLQAK